MVNLTAEGQGWSKSILVVLFNAAVQIFMVYAVFWIFNIFFHTPWSRT